ncbi:Thioesterase superfamily [Teratosphaeria destructans]|uniref:Thioesterase superfamily n=1 Tax=Teratosphaeria destructans TaxID=418781 RepID=A0A9W7W722_9PEZI|nr:Thioesterase superfamily [Teratosphaeria destructans]
MATAPVSDSVNGFIHPPSDAETLTLFEPDTEKQKEINERIVNHPLAKQLREAEGVTESRPHLKIPPAMRPHNLTGGALMGDGKVEVPPLQFVDTSADLPSLTQISHLGPGLCGHPGIVHGGMLATMLDEGLARACFPALPNRVGVTASLKIDYRVPCPADSYVVLRARTTKVEGRKAWVEGWIEVLDPDGGVGEGKRLVEAEALFIEPKGAKGMARLYTSQ